MLRVGVLVTISERWPWALTWQFCPVIGCGRSELFLNGSHCVGSGLNELYSTDVAASAVLAEAKPWDTTRTPPQDAGS